MKIIYKLFFISFILFCSWISKTNAQNSFYFNQITNLQFSGLYCCTLTDGGDLIAAGRTDSTYTGIQRGLSVCFDTATGNIKWARKTNINELTFYAVDAYKDRIYYIGHYTPSNATPRGLLMATDTSGNLLWSYYTANAGSYGWDVEAAWDKGCVSYTQISGNFEAGQVSRFSPTGQLLWSRRIRFPTINSLDAESVTITQDHHILVTGRVQNIHGMQDVYIVEFDEFGNFVWQKCITTGHDIRPSDIISLQNKDIVICGEYEGVTTAVMCCDSLGNVKWLNNYYLANYLNIAHATETPSGNIMIAGNTSYYPDLLTLNPAGYPINSREFLIANATFSQVVFGAGNRAFGVGMFGGSQFDRKGLFVKAEENGFVGCNDNWLISYAYPKSNSDSLSGYLIIDTIAYLVTPILVGFDTLTLISNGCLSNGINNPFSISNTMEAFPNPTNDQTTISWNNSVEIPTEILVYDESGKLVRDEKLIPGTKKYVFAKNNLHSGIYHLLFLKDGKYFSSTDVVLCDN